MADETPVKDNEIQSKTEDPVEENMLPGMSNSQEIDAGLTGVSPEIKELTPDPKATPVTVHTPEPVMTEPCTETMEVDSAPVPTVPITEDISSDKLSDAIEARLETEMEVINFPTAQQESVKPGEQPKEEQSAEENVTIEPTTDPSETELTVSPAEEPKPKSDQTEVVTLPDKCNTENPTDLVAIHDATAVMETEPAEDRKVPDEPIAIVCKTNELKDETRTIHKVTHGKLEIPTAQPQVKIMRSPEIEGAVKSLQQSENKEQRTPILRIPLVKPRETVSPGKRPLISPTEIESPTKRSRSAVLDSVVNRLKERATEPKLTLLGLAEDGTSPNTSPAISPTSSLSSSHTPTDHNIPIEMDSKVPRLIIKNSPTSINPKQTSPKARSPPQQCSPSQQRSPFKSPVSPSRSGLPTVHSNFISPRVSPTIVSPHTSPILSMKLSPSRTISELGTGSEMPVQIMSFKEHIDALVTKELFASQENTEEKNTDDVETTGVVGTENDQPKLKPTPIKRKHKRRGKPKKDTPSKQPKVKKVDNPDDNAMDVPDTESTEATTGAEENPDDETSQDASRSKSKSKLARTPRKTATCSTLEDLGKTRDDMGNAIFLADNVYEYQWPQETKDGEWSVIQEQVSEYLGIKSFKRKYPNLVRRSIVMKERNFLQDQGVVTETQCDLGLTALQTEEVLDLMAQDYPSKYKEFTTVLKERQRQRLAEKRKAAQLIFTDKNKLAEMRRKAIKSASEFNSIFMRERREERRAYLDMQTLEVHYPRGKMKVLAPECTTVGAYPVALIPGQFQEYYKKYTPDELKYLPMNTVLYPAPKRHGTIYADPNQADAEADTESDDDLSSSASDSESQPAPSPAPMETNDSEPPAVVADKEPSLSVVDKGKACKACQENDQKPALDEELITCAECGAAGHPTCLELTESMVKLCRTYPWQCMECKTCVECMDPYDEDKMMFCDRCDRGYHTFCLGVKEIPTGRWECPSCKPRESSSKASPQKKRGRKKRTEEKITPIIE